MVRRLILLPILLVLALAVAPAAQAATLALSPASGPDGTSVRATGSGYGKKLPGTLTFGSQQVASFKSRPRGTIDRSFVVPAGFSGPTTVTARTSAGTGTASFDVTGTPPPPPPPPPPGDVTTQPPDGGADYYGRFAHGLPSGPAHFPIGVWGAYDQTQANIDIDKGLGINLYVWPADNTIPISRFEANGMNTLLTSDWYGRTGVATSPANNGYMLADEVDMTHGPGAGYTEMQNANNAAPSDGRARYANYGKGVMFWETDAEAARFLNDFQQLVSADIYWFTDPGYVCGFSEGGRFLLGRDEQVPEAQCRRASNYGAVVDEMQRLDRMDGNVKPIWNFVELGHPFSENAPTITPPQVNAAVWHSIIAGARGIVYFNHSFGGPCITHHVLRSSCGNYPAVQAQVDQTNALVQQLAPALNSPTVTSGFTHSGTVKAMAKLNGSQFTVFAGSRENASSSATFTLPVGDTTATVVGEGRTIPVVNGSFTDSFGGGNAIHIYRIG